MAKATLGWGLSVLSLLLLILFPVRKFFRALPGMVSEPRQAEPPRGDRGKYRRRSMGLERASLPGLLRDIGGIDDLFVLNGACEDRAVA